MTPPATPPSNPALGFPRTPTPPAAQTAAKPTPLPKRPKGRWFIGLLLLAACAYGGYLVWDSFFRYRAYGTVQGRVIQLSAPWDGAVTHFHVREGDTVRQGDLLVTLDNVALRHRLGQIDDELHTVQAQFQAEAVKLKWQAAFHLDQPNGAAARYQELWGQYLQEKSQLDKLNSDLAAAERLHRENALARLELERLRCDREGLQRKVERLQAALDEHKKYADLSALLLTGAGDLVESLKSDGDDQLKPYLVKIAALRSERTRVQQQIEAGRLVAPCHGRVVKLHRFGGEHSRAAEPVVSLLEEGSLKVVLFVPQSASSSFQAGSDVEMIVEPHFGRLSGKVERLGDQFEAPPAGIKRHYAADQKLLPVHVQVHPESAHGMALRVDSVVKLP